MKISSASKIKMNSYDELFGSAESKENIVELPVDVLDDFEEHPFLVQDDEDMEALVDSIKQNGIITPLTVCPKKSGRYEIVSGHRRKHAAIIAGFKTVPTDVRELEHDKAVVLMVDSNLQREHIKPSEKALAYRMKMRAVSHQGQKGNASASMIGSSSGESGRQVQRYIRLGELNPLLLPYIDNNQISVTAGVELSYLKLQEQTWVENICTTNSKYPSIKQAVALRKYSQEKKLTFAMTELIIMGETVTTRKIKLNNKKLSSYFPLEYDEEQIQQIIYTLLEKWKAEHE